jgi:hypothetical protein
MPVTRLTTEEWVHAPRLPLGDPYLGTCHARPGEASQPSETEQRELCNYGYARGRCDRFPEECADAVRFSVSGETEGRVQLVWILEKSHAPAEFGTLEYAAGRISDAGPLLSAQATAFLRSYRPHPALPA